MESIGSAVQDGRRYVIVGGGLQAGLLAHAVLHHQPGAEVVVIERADSLGGNHTWCFHAGDIPDSCRYLTSAFTEHVWPGYDVAFPDRARRIDRPYRALSADRLRDRMARLAEESGRLTVRTGCAVLDIDRRGATLATGERVAGDIVVDARGPGPLTGVRCGYQKFLGLEIELRRPGMLKIPLLMDARVDQTDGFRFLYGLPFSPTRVLLEDTYFSDHPDLDESGLEEAVLEYAAANGFEVERVVRREIGVLPMPWGGTPICASDGVLRAGFGGGWFHPATGYSFPAAAKLADFVARGGFEDASRWGAFVSAHRSRYRYACLLNRLLFGSFEPSRRWHVFARFYGYDEPLIERFYGMDFTLLDRVRLLSGRPPRGMSWRRTAKEGFPLWT